MKTMPLTREGWSAASNSARCAPIDQATRMALSVSVASSTASASAANSASAYAPGSWGDRTGRCRDHRMSPRGSGARGRESASSSSASARSTRRKQEDGWRAAAVHLVEGADAVALDVPVEVGVARPGLFRARLPNRQFTQIQGRASYTMLNGVSAARRKRVKPPALTTSRIRASPACAPSASPTSCDSDAGVQRNVEKL